MPTTTAKLPPGYAARLKRGKALLTKIKKEHDGEPMISFDGLEAAIVGVGRQHCGECCLIYSGRLLIEALEVTHACAREDAWDWYGCNVECLYAGKTTPIIMDDFSDD